MKTFTDFTGQRFGRLLVVKRIGHSKYREILWEVLCDCGSIKQVTSGNLKGKTKSCGCYRKDRMQGLSMQLFFKGIGISGLNMSYKNTRANAKKRNLEFSITLDEYKNIIFRNCYWCGDEPAQKCGSKQGAITYNGIDRYDNSIGYTLYNSVPCCFGCNKIKGIQSPKEFLDKVHKVANKHPWITLEIKHLPRPKK